MCKATTLSEQGAGDIPSPQNIFYLTYDHGADVIINRYRLFRHSSRSPRSWTFEASTDNATFVTLDTTYQNSNLSDPSYSGNSPEDNVANANSADFNSSDTAYRYYRFGFTGANGGADELKVSELQFFRVQITTRNMKNVLDDLETDLGSLTTTVDGKAEASTVSTLSTTVSGKADQSALDTLSNTVTTKVSLDVSDTEYAISRHQHPYNHAYNFGDVSGLSNPKVYDALSNLTDGNSATGCVAEIDINADYFDIMLETDRAVIANRVVLHPVSLPATSNWTFEDFGTTTVLGNIYPPEAQFGYDAAGVVTMLGSVSNVGTASSGHDITVSHTTARRRRWVVRVWPRRVEDVGPGPDYITVNRYFWGLSKIDFEYDHVPAVNDVVFYDGTRYVPRTMNTRNYQFKQQEGLYVTQVASQGQFVELQGFHGSQAISITPLTSGSTIRIRFIIRGEFIWDHGTNFYNDLSFRLLWNVKKIVNGVSSDLNAPTIPSSQNIQQTLANQEVGYQGNNADTTMDTYNICFFDTNGADQGQTITYIPQITIRDNFSSANEFRLNSVARLTNDVEEENSISTAEVEEILTGPPLTTNNVAVSGNPVHNDVLTYQSGQWTNTAMHTRNYQYKIIDDMVTTNNIQTTWLDVNGFTGSNALTITTLTSNPKIRVHFTIRGEFSLTFVHNVYFQLTRSINGGTPVELNATGTTYPSLTTTMISDHDDAVTSMDSYEIYFVDEITANVGSTIVYVPQVRWNSTTTMIFQLNRNYTTQQSYENTISFSEAEEILTGPPLTVNNVAITTTPMVGDSLVYDGSVWTSGFAELLQSVSRIGAGYGPPEGFINEDPQDNHNRGSAPPLGQSAIYIPTEFQGNCTINGFTEKLFDNISNNLALNPGSNGAPSTSVPYVLEIAIDVPKVVTNYAMYFAPNNSPYATAWEFQVYDSVNTDWVTLDTKTGQTMMSSTSRPSDQSQYQEVQLCGGDLLANDIVSGWPRASTVYVDNANNIFPNKHNPQKLFDNAISDYYDGWHSVSDGATATSTHPHEKWDDATNSYVSLNAGEYDAYLQIRFTQPRMITKVLMLWRHNLPDQFPKSFSIYGSNAQPSVLRSTTGMNLLFVTDGTGYSKPPTLSTTWSGSAQNNLNSAISFVIPAANQGKYEYLTFHFTEAWNPGSAIVFTEMFLYHNEDQYATSSVNTSILSRLYRFSITGSSGTGANNYIQLERDWHDVQAAHVGHKGQRDGHTDSRRLAAVRRKHLDTPNDSADNGGLGWRRSWKSRVNYQ